MGIRYGICIYPVNILYYIIYFIHRIYNKLKTINYFIFMQYICFVFTYIYKTKQYKKNFSHEIKN